MTFDEKVRSMSARQIIEAMIDGIKNPVVKLDFDTFGRYDKQTGVCYGCAATNSICKIANISLNGSNIRDSSKRAMSIESSHWFLHTFENAIDFLRLGNIVLYNNLAKDAGFQKISIPLWWKSYLFALDNDNYNYNIKYYEALAMFQEDPNTVEP